MGNEFKAFGSSPHDASAVAIRDQSLGHAGPNVSGGLVFQLLPQTSLPQAPLLDFIDGDGQALVLVVTSITRLCRLVALRGSYELLA